MKSVQVKFGALMMMLNEILEVIPGETLVSADIVIYEQIEPYKISVSIKGKDYHENTLRR